MTSRRSERGGKVASRVLQCDALHHSARVVAFIDGVFEPIVNLLLFDHVNRIGTLYEKRANG